MPVTSFDVSTTLAERLGYDADGRLLIVNCDDLGSCHAANVGCFDALRDGKGGVSELDHVGPIDPRTARWVACDASITTGKCEMRRTAGTAARSRVLRV